MELLTHALTTHAVARDETISAIMMLTATVVAICCAKVRGAGHSVRMIGREHHVEVGAERPLQVDAEVISEPLVDCPLDVA